MYALRNTRVEQPLDCTYRMGQCSVWDIHRAVSRQATPRRCHQHLVPGKSLQDIGLTPCNHILTDNHQRFASNNNLASTYAITERPSCIAQLYALYKFVTPGGTPSPRIHRPPHLIHPVDYKKVSMSSVNTRLGHRWYLRTLGKLFRITNFLKQNRTDQIPICGTARRTASFLQLLDTVHLYTQYGHKTQHIRIKTVAQ